MTAISEVTNGLIETIADVSHDPDQADWFDTDEYIENIPNPTRVLLELARWIHAEAL